MAAWDPGWAGPVASSAALVAAAAVLPARAQAQRDGTVEITIFGAGFIVGGGGNGMLHFQGKGYNLSVGGVSLVATIGAPGSSASARSRTSRT